MIYFVEGKNYRTIVKDCQAVSEVYGTLLMISIVIIGFSGIALIVYSDGGVEKPEHIPHTDLCEIMDTLDSTVEISHSGGDAIDLSAIKIILIFPDGERHEISKSKLVIIFPDGGRHEISKSNFKDPDGTEPDDDVFMLGDSIVINDDKIKNDVDVDMYFIDMPSQQVIQKTVLKGNYWELPYWFTPDPYGIIRDKSGNNTEIFLPTELTNEINDGSSTPCHMEKGLMSYETFTFGMDQYNLNLKDPLTKVLLKVVYANHDNSQQDMKLEINVGGPDWIKVADLKSYNDFSDCDTNLAPFNITGYVNTVAKLNNLTVRFSATGNAASDNKNGWIDFIGIHVES